jgi:hypothetical protein
MPRHTAQQGSCRTCVLHDVPLRRGDSPCSSPRLPSRHLRLHPARVLALPARPGSCARPAARGFRCGPAAALGLRSARRQRRRCRRSAGLGAAAGGVPGASGPAGTGTGIASGPRRLGAAAGTEAAGGAAAGASGAAEEAAPREEAAGSREAGAPRPGRG